MYLKSLEIENFRKFGSKNNVIEFVTPYQEGVSLPTSVSNATTLIVGKNNAGKTTITAALKQAVNDESLSGNKFNYHYLKRLLKSYTVETQDFTKIETPYISFVLTIGLDADPDTFSINNISDFIDVDDLESKKKENCIKIKVKYEVEEEQEYLNIIKITVKNWKSKSIDNEEVMFRDFIDLINNQVKFSKKFYDIHENEVDGTKFKISNLIDIKIINANLEDGSRTLSTVFNKIIKYKLNLDSEKPNKDKINEKISTINADITEMVGKEHNKSVNEVVGTITDASHMQVNLRSGLDFSSMFNQLINYEFKENGNFVPENQFGLGYKNLMKIIGQLIDYIEQYEINKVHSKVNLICVEEPENYMHPQMQELFIKNIDDAINLLLSKTKKRINSQLILTTHSSHILNSKIHTSNTFNNINYLSTGTDGFTKSIPLDDTSVSGISKTGDKKSEIDKEELNFLKKHIKFKVSDLFFTDAVILVEGITEEQLLSYLISENPKLNKHYISIFNINGAFAHIYKPLIDLLEIPCLVITDLDIKRSKKEKGEESEEGKEKIFHQISSLKDRETTNEVIKQYICGKTPSDRKKRKKEPVKLPEKMEYFEDPSKGGFKVVYQKDSIKEYFASSFEEAFILTNFDNVVLNETLRDIKPNIYDDIVGKGDSLNYENSIKSSFKWQRKLSDSKSEFANTLLYRILASKDTSPIMPEYITIGIEWLQSRLNG
ncbi:AAA family ATPase [Aliivibrio wodanis]|uniref:AAA family ATPase n=1 Tax=Aliivibrio wodanis TaxID=80852 RepID=UPI00406C4727